MKHINLKSNSRQAYLVLNHMQRVGSITPREALMDHNIYRLAAVVHRLRKDEGIKINSKIKDHPINGSHYAEYSLAA